MNQKEIVRIERSLGFALPDSYSAFLLDFPQRLVDAYPDDHSPRERELFNTSEPIISTNTLVREPNSKWPDKFLIVGMDIGTNFRCIDRQLSKSPVYLWFHEDGEFEKIATSLAKYVDKLIENYVAYRKELGN